MISLAHELFMSEHYPVTLKKGMGKKEEKKKLALHGIEPGSSDTTLRIANGYRPIIKNSLGRTLHN